MRALAGAVMIAATVIAYQMGQYESRFLETLAVGFGILLILADFLPDVIRLVGWLERRPAP
jgi:hypothetical protein